MSYYQTWTKKYLLTEGESLSYQLMIYICTFSSIMFIILAIIMRVEQKRRLLEEFLYRRTITKSKNLIEILTRLLGPLMPGREKMDQIRYYLEQLEIKGITPEKVYFYTIGGGIILGSIYFVILLFLNVYVAVLGIGIGLLAGYNLPIIYLKSKYEDLQKEKQIGILPYVEMLQITCEAGLTFTLAIDRVYEYYPTPLSLEFKKSNNDFMANIKTRRESLTGIIDRVGGDEIRFLIESIIQSIDTGTPMKGVLKMLADTIRRDLRKKIINQGQQAKWKNFIVSICFQFPPYIYILAGPALAGLMGAI